MVDRTAAHPNLWVLAHRGASQDCPENTFAAFDEALRQGADGIELDVQLSRDGVPVVFHDRTLSRAGGRGRRVADLDLPELLELEAGRSHGERFRGERIPTLEATLARYGPGTRLLIEMKAREGRGGSAGHRELAGKVAALVARSGLADRVLLLCFDMDVLRYAKEAVPQARCALNVKPPPRLDPSLRALLPELCAISADIRTLTAGFARGVREAGKDVFAWTCNTRAQVDRALEAGVRGVMSDRPAWLAGRLRRDATRIP
jgi:glycerophosphoryl diester phosphodiesterase